MTISRTSWERARAMLTICWEAAGRRPTGVEGEISGWPRRASSAAAVRRASPRWVKPAVAGSWPRLMFSATVRCSTRSSSW
jgi:hypothetical protein